MPSGAPGQPGVQAPSRDPGISGRGFPSFGEAKGLQGLEDAAFWGVILPMLTTHIWNQEKEGSPFPRRPPWRKGGGPSGSSRSAQAAVWWVPGVRVAGLLSGLLADSPLPLGRFYSTASLGSPCVPTLRLPLGVRKGLAEHRALYRVRLHFLKIYLTTHPTVCTTCQTLF